MRPLFSSFSIIFLHFPPHMQPVTFHLPFLLISIIFINKCAKIPFNALAIVFSNFLSHKQPNKHPLGCLSQHSAWNKCPSHPWLFFLTLLHEIFTRVVTKPSPLGDTILGVQSHIYLSNLLKEDILLMELYNTARCSIYNERSQEKNIMITCHHTA